MGESTKPKSGVVFGTVQIPPCAPGNTKGLPCIKCAYDAGNCTRCFTGNTNSWGGSCGRCGGNGKELHNCTKKGKCKCLGEKDSTFALCDGERIISNPWRRLISRRRDSPVSSRDAN